MIFPFGFMEELGSQRFSEISKAKKTMRLPEEAF